MTFCDVIIEHRFTPSFEIHILTPADVEYCLLLMTPPCFLKGCPRGVMSKALDNGIALSRSLSNKSPWERYETPCPPSYGLNNTTTVLLEGWLWH